MRRVLLVLALMGLTLGACGSIVSADENDLSGGVFITHAPSDFVYSQGMDWCAEYGSQYGIVSCQEQITNMPLSSPANQTLFYVVAAWNDEKVWCGSEFGISADFDGRFYFTEWGACLPDHLELSTPGWPGANEGTAVVAAGTVWEGNFVPVYYFTGYAYYSTRIQLDVDPAQDMAITGNCLVPAELFDMVCLGAMGIGDDLGEACCPPSGGDEEAVCCTLGECTIVTEAVCAAGGGTWYEELDSCDPNPCPEEYACCFGTICNVRPEAECDALGGTWHWGFYCAGGTPAYDCAGIGEIRPCCVPGYGGECVMTWEQDCLGPLHQGDFYESWDNCEQNPCSTPTNEASWGSIKTIYR
jgi:uncharacterized protein YceK